MKKKRTRIKKFLHVLQFVLHLIACSSQIKPSIQELKPITRTPKKRKYKLSSLTLHWWTRVLPFIPNKNNSLGLKTQTTWPLKIKINSHGLKTQTAWPTRQTPAKPSKTQTKWSIWRRAPLQDPSLSTKTPSHHSKITLSRHPYLLCLQPLPFTNAPTLGSSSQTHTSLSNSLAFAHSLSLFCLIWRASKRGKESPLSLFTI